MIFNEEETVNVLANKFVYIVPNVSVFGDFYNLANLSVDVLENIRNDGLFPATGLTQKVNNVISKKSAEFFTKIINDGKFYVSDITSYEVMMSLIDESIEILKETDYVVFEEMKKNNEVIPMNYFDVNFEYAVNNDSSNISIIDVDDVEFDNITDLLNSIEL